MDPRDGDVDNSCGDPPQQHQPPTGGGELQQQQQQDGGEGQGMTQGQQQQQEQQQQQAPPQPQPEGKSIIENGDGVEEVNLENNGSGDKSKDIKDKIDNLVENERTHVSTDGDVVAGVGGDAGSGTAPAGAEEAETTTDLSKQTPSGTEKDGSLCLADSSGDPAGQTHIGDTTGGSQELVSPESETGGRGGLTQDPEQQPQIVTVGGDNHIEKPEAGDRDGGDVETVAGSQTGDDEVAVGESSNGAVKNQADVEAAANKLSQDVASLEADLDDFFNTAPPGKGDKLSHKGLFPALDNVDFETDEEAQDAEKDGRKHDDDGGGGGERQVHGDMGSSNSHSPREDGQMEQRRDADGARTMSEVTGLEDGETTIEKVAYFSGDGEGTNGQIAILNSPQSNRQNYPLNYQNYKVCRELEPGVKECLILETGELFICMDKSKSSAHASPDPHPNEDATHRSVFMVQPDHGSGRKMSRDISQQPKPTTANLVSSSEAFAYVSLQDGTGQSDMDPAETHLQDHQQAYITANGIPVILDNAEDDLKLGLQVEMLRAGSQQPHVASSPTMLSDNEKEDFLKTDVVEDVLSGGERDSKSQGLVQEKPSSSKKSKRKKEKKERFVELQPDFAADSTEDTATLSGSEVNVNSNNINNNNEDDDEEGEGNVNGNANSPRHRDRELQESGTYTRPSYSVDRSSRGESSDYPASYNRYSSDSRGPDLSGSRSYSQSPYTGNSYSDSRGHRSRDGSSYYRSGEPSSVDSSRLSTRYSQIERGDPRRATSKPESVTVPKFKTLQDQQVSWLEMFKMIEQQHRSELQTQYFEHQKILQEMQQNMEKELNRQQNTLKKRLTTHREILEELSPGRHGSRPAVEGRNMNQSRSHEGDSSSIESQRSGQLTSTDHSSHITLQGVPVSLRNPPPRYQSDSFDLKSSEDMPVKRSLEKEFSSPTRPADTSLNVSRVSVGDKQLRGGVYSSPMPLAKVKHKNSPRSSKSYEENQRNSPRGTEGSRNANATQRGGDDWMRDGHPPGSADVSLTESEEVLSPRTRISLREKHAKHLADLRAYYEEELRELRQLLSCRQDRDRRDRGDEGVSVLSAAENILAGENHQLRQKCHQLQDAYHDAKVEVRELEQKLQGLEIRASDYAQRYDNTQAQVLSLKSRLEELTEYAKEKESVARDLEVKSKRVSDSLQSADKKEKELTDSLHSAKTTIQRLVDKYETLEKDHMLLKESASEVQEKLYTSRTEAIESNNKLSRLELENKQLKHNMEILKHELDTARSALQMRTSYEDAYHAAGSPSRGRSVYTSPQTARTRSMERSYGSKSQERPIPQKELSPESETDSECLRSPIMRAERELKKLQQSQEFAPKLQRKFYGTEVPSAHGGPPITVNRSSNRTVSSPQASKSLSPRDRKVRMTPQGREVSSRSVTSTSSSSVRRNLSEETGQSSRSEQKASEVRSRTEQSYRDRNIPSKKSVSIQNGLTSDEAINRIKSGEIVSRPAWEDIYTSLTSSRQDNSGSKGPPMNYTRDQMIRERLQNIENLERKYDDLCNEKRKYESALSKIPAHGHRGEKEKLETELDRVDRELGSVRMSLKRFHVLKSTI